MKNVCTAIICGLLSICLVFFATGAGILPAADVSADAAAADVAKGMREMISLAKNGGTKVPTPPAEWQQAQVTATEVVDTMLERVDMQAYTACIAEHSREISGTVTSNRSALDPVYITLGGRQYNLLSVGGALGALMQVKNTRELKYVLLTYLELGLTDVITLLAKLLPEGKHIQALEGYQSENFMEGHETFLDEAADHARWSLGYAQRSLLPEDIGEKPYYLAGYLLQNFPANTVEDVLDDMKVRTIVLDDGSGRGKVAFSTIDSIGLANADVRTIRDTMQEYAAANNIVSINVFATHTHSAIDTLGLWNPFLLKIPNNILAAKTDIVPAQTGTDPDYMAFVQAKIAESIQEACDTMVAGDLYYSEKDGSGYIQDDREPPSYMGDISRLRFVPSDKSLQETLIVNMAAHPYKTGLKTDKSSGKELSADYVYYLEKELNQNGYQFMFFNGAICGIYSSTGRSNDGLPTQRRSEEAERYGRELAWFVMSMTKTQQQIIESPYVDAQTIAREQAASSSYTLWFEDWKPVEEVPVKPILNIRLAETALTVENPVIEAVGKLGLVNHTILKSKTGLYQTVTEVGYLEIGETIKVALVPGEFSPELVTGGGACDAENAFSAQDFPYPSMNEIVGADLHVFGLANDMLGYILPDNDYCMIFFDDVQPFGDHYQETISFGRSTGTAIVGAFEKVYQEVRANEDTR